MQKLPTKLILLALLVIVVPLIFIRGNVVGFFEYLQGEQSYLGRSLLKTRVLVKTPSLLHSIVHSEDFEDFRRRHPNFQAAPETILNSKTTRQELLAYNDFLSKVSDIKASDGGQLSYRSVVELTHQIHRVFKKNLISGRNIEAGVLGRNASHPEDFVYQLINSRTACGTVGEATVALSRELGFKSRLAIVSTNPAPLAANHIVAEVYVPSRNRWILVDPMIDYTGAESVFELIGNEKKAQSVSMRHDSSARTYSAQSVVWIDRRSPLRKILYFTPLARNHAVVTVEIAKID